MWSVIGLVTTGLALAAFVTAAVASLARAALHRTGTLIESAPQADRGRLVREALESFHVDTSRIKSEERLDALLRAQMRMRERSRMSTLWFALAGLVVLSLLAAYAISRGAAASEAPAPLPTTATDASPGTTRDPAHRMEDGARQAPPSAPAPETSASLLPPRAPAPE